MNTQQLKWIGGAILVLLLVWGGGRLLSSGTDRLSGDLRLPTVSPDSADSVSVSGTGESVVLVRAATGGWTANGFAASSDAVKEFFGALEGGHGGRGGGAPPELVARSSGSFSALGVDSAVARRVRVVRGDRTLLDLFVSERGPTYDGAYVRAPGDSAIYAVPGRLGAMARRGLDDWRDRTIAAVAADSVQEIVNERGTRRVVLRRVDGGWRTAQGSADSTAVQKLLDRYRTLMAAGFPTTAQLDSAFRSRVERRATLRGKAGTLLTLEFDSTANGFWVRKVGAGGGGRGGRDGIYRINSWDVDQLFPNDSTLRSKP